MIVAQLIVFCGMFTFAILIGVVSDEIANKVDEVKTGNSKVYEESHGNLKLERSTHSAIEASGCGEE